MGYIMDDSKGYIDFKKERGSKKKSDKHKYKNKIKIRKTSKKRNRR